MKNIKLTLVAAVSLPLLAGCASTPVTLNPVGPAPANATANAPAGWLRVATATETHEIGDNTYYYPHTGYSIHDGSGKIVKFVPNHIGDMDESPSLVQVPAGNYKVVADSESYGQVTVPVVIQPDRITEVNLQSTWKVPANAATNDIVRLPNGEPVGWRTAAN